MAVGLQHADDSRFLVRRKLGEDGRPFSQCGERAFVRRLHLGPRRNMLGVKAHVAANFSRDDSVVARENLHGDTVLAQQAQCFGGGFLRRVEERDEPGENQIALILHRDRRMVLRERLVADGDHPKAVLIQPVAQCLEPLAKLRRQWPGAAFLFHLRADVEHLLDGPLADKNVFLFRPRQHDRHAAPREVKGNLVLLPPRLGHFAQAQLLGSLNHGSVEQVLQPGLEQAVEIGVFEHSLALAAVRVQVPDQHHFVLRQRTRLVRAKHVHRAEVLDGLQMLHDRFLTRHRDGAPRQIRVHNHWQHLGRQPDRDGDREQEGLQPVVLRQPVDEEDRRRHDHHEFD